jgi:hypothetical protein
VSRPGKLVSALPAATVADTDDRPAAVPVTIVAVTSLNRPCTRDTPR